MNLLNKKDDLINQIFIITKEALGFLSDESFDDYQKLVDVYKKRQGIIDEIDTLDMEIKAAGLSANDYPDIKRSMEITLEGIGTLDEKIAEIIKNQSSDLAEDIKSIKEGRKGLDMTRNSEVVGFKLDVSK